VMLVSSLATGSLARAVTENAPCLPPVSAEAEDSALEAARAKLAELQSQWAAGEFRGYNRFSGTSTTNGAVAREIEKRENELADYFALGDEAVASGGSSMQSGRAIKETIQKAQQRGDQALAQRARDALRVWEESVREKTEETQERIDNLRTLLAELRQGYEDAIAALESEAGADLDPMTGLAFCDLAPGEDEESAAGDEPPPTILSVDEQIARCMTLVGDERDICLANLVLLHKSPAPCQAAPDGRCGESEPWSWANARPTIPTTRRNAST